MAWGGISTLMKIVDVAEFYAEQGGGVKTYIHQKLEAGAKAGHEVVIVAPGPEDAEEERLGGRIVWVKGPPLPPDPRYYVLYREKAVHQILDREQPDVVEGSSPWTGGWFAARWRGEAAKTFIFHQDPVAVYPHTFLDRILKTGTIDRFFGWYWAYLRSLSSRFDATVVSGYWLADKLKGFDLKNPCAVPFGIEKSQFSPSRRDDAIRTELLKQCNLPPHGKLLMNVSRFHPEKRLHVLIEAIKQANKTFPVGLVVFGDGPLRKKIQKLAAGSPNVHLAGYTKSRDDLAAALASGDAMIHGSAAETYGLVVAEGLCSGLPLIVPNVGGAADLAHPDYAETYRPGDVTACADAMTRLFSRDPQSLAEACQKAADSRVGTMDDHFEQLFELYQKLARKKA